VTEQPVQVDLTTCDREPIHIPGSIQPHGVLLALTEPELTVTQLSENIGDHLPLNVADVLAQPLSVIVDDPASVDEVRKTLREERWYETNPLQITAHGTRFDAIVHRHEGVAILELEPNPDPPVPRTVHHPFRRALLQLQHVRTLPELAEVVVEQMRRVTGFERVLFYRFHEDGHGSVDAEAKAPELEPYLGLHYPASDLPEQTRQLYVKSWLRIIVDARYTPARLVPPLRADTGGPLDLSFAVLRSVSPIHREYMANMGTRAAMSVSLVVRDRLWGLISCLNHTGPRRVPHDTRSACEFLGRLASLQIDAIEDREALALRAGRRATEQVLSDAMTECAMDEATGMGLMAHPTDLMMLVRAEGAALVGAGKSVSCGRTPSPEFIQEIASWLEKRGELRPFATSSLSNLFPRALEVSDVASGLLTFALPGFPQRRLLWFRPEVLETVHWAGNPTKSVAVDSSKRLHPRRSFALWTEEARNRSQPWTASDLEAADELRRRAIEIDIERRLVSEQSAVRAREEVIAVVSHDLRNPLSTILVQAETMMRQAPPGGEKAIREVERIRRSAMHMKAMVDDLLDLATIESRRFTLRLESVESRLMVEEAVLAASPLAEAKRITIAAELIDAPKLEADPERVFRVLSNLLGNAIRFTPSGGTITVRAECRGGELLITIVDTGPGIPADMIEHVFDRYWKARPTSSVGAGLGLYIAKGIVDAHGGRIWAESSAGGARLSFTLPLPESNRARGAGYSLPKAELRTDRH
jgi:light-regulated signal transduction histidine kinase (bacteriophytochrome)